MSFSIYMPTRWLFGAGALNELGRQPLPGRTALLVSSSGRSAKDSGSLYRVMELLAHGGAEFRLFDQVESNPSKDTVMAGAGSRGETAATSSSRSAAAASWTPPRP